MRTDQSSKANQILSNQKLNDFFNILATDDARKTKFAKDLIDLVNSSRTPNEIGSAEDIESNAIELMKLYRDNSKIESEKKRRIDTYIEVQEVSKGVSVKGIKAILNSRVNIGPIPQITQKQKETTEAQEKRLERLNKYSDELRQDLEGFTTKGEMKAFLSKKKSELQSLITKNSSIGPTFIEGKVTDGWLENLNKIDTLDSYKSKLKFLNF
jgi:hypothetical protein